MQRLRLAGEPGVGGVAHLVRNCGGLRALCCPGVLPGGRWQCAGKAARLLTQLHAINAQQAIEQAGLLVCSSPLRSGMMGMIGVVRMSAAVLRAAATGLAIFAARRRLALQNEQPVAARHVSSGVLAAGAGLNQGH